MPDHFTRTIRDQIGVGALMRVGARDFVYSDKVGARYLQFAVTGARGYHTAVKVTLEPSDTYTVELVRTHRRTFDVTVADRQDMVYADGLSRTVQQVCGELASGARDA